MLTRDSLAKMEFSAIPTSLEIWTSKMLKGSSCTSSKKLRRGTLLYTGKSQSICSLKIVREQLQRNAREGNYYLRISMDHLLNFDEVLAQ